MAYGLGSRRTNRFLMGAYGAIALGWSVWRAFDYSRSSYVQGSVTPLDGAPPIELFGGVVRAGDVVEVSVEKSDATRLMGFIDFLTYTEIVLMAVFLVVGIFFAYRFFDRVIAGRAFERGASLDLAVVGVSLVVFPFLAAMSRTMVTNCIVNVLELGEVVDTARSFGYVLVAAFVAGSLQFVYATIQQGTKLAKDAEGLV